MSNGPVAGSWRARCYGRVEGAIRIDHAIRHAPHRSSPVSKRAAATNQSRRARRAADRRAATAPTGAEAKRRSPILLITAIVGGIGVVVLGALILLQGQGQQGVASTGLVTPSAPTPVTLAAERALGKADAPVTLEVWSD